MKIEELKVFKVGPDTVAAKSKEELRSWYKDEFGIEGDDFEEEFSEVEVSEKFLSNKIETEAGSGKFLTTREIIEEELANDGGGDWPFMLYSQEY